MSSIQPFNKTTIVTATRFSLDISQLILNTSATFRVSLYDIDDKCIDNKYITIEGNDYKNWNSSFYCCTTRICFSLIIIMF